jgi:hypothetical protein
MCNGIQLKGKGEYRGSRDRIDTTSMIYTILQLMRAVSVLIDLINDGSATISGILKGGETQHMQLEFEAGNLHVIT